MTNVRMLPVGEGNEEITLALDELAREGARRMIAAALRAEADEYVERFSDEVDEDGHRLVVRNGRARERQVTVGSGTIPVRAPRVNDKRVDEEGERQRFSSRILPAYARRSPKVGEVIPILYLRGLSTGDFRPALEGLLGEDAAGLSATSVSRLCKEWEAHHDRFRQRLLSFSRYAYLFMDGIHVQVRLGEDPKVCLLIVIGVREDGVQGAARGRGRLPRVDRELGRRVPRPQASWPERAEARRRRRRAGRVGRAPRRVPRRGRAALLVSRRRERDRLPPQAAAAAREGTAGRDHRGPDPQATPGRRSRCSARSTARSTPRRSRSSTATGQPLTAFYDYPAEHWRHLRTTNPIESSFATVRLRTRVTKGAGSKTAALAMAYKLLESAQERWRRFNGHELVADVLDGVKFKDGIKVTDDDNHDNETTDERVAA